MTDDELAAIEARANAASPGPWTNGLDCDPPDDGIESIFGGGICHITNHGNVNTVARTGQAFSHADAIFITHARCDIPALIDHIRFLRAENEELLALPGRVTTTPP